VVSSAPRATPHVDRKLEGASVWAGPPPDVLGEPWRCIRAARKARAVHLRLVPVLLFSTTSIATSASKASPGEYLPVCPNCGEDNSDKAKFYSVRNQSERPPRQAD
jgi:hypothetical protein